MFFLLASFMMVSLTMTKQQTVSVNLPTAGKTDKNFKPDMINLALNAAGDVFWEKERLMLPALENRLAERYARDPKTPVYISGDGETKHAAMIRVLDLARRCGFTKVAFQVRTGAAEAPATPATQPTPAAP
jgi:biopolymer transport protein ExbD